jgi:hypothetical protein
LSRRWDGDTRGSGVGDAAALTSGVAELLEATRAPAWVAEDPETHLLPHLRHAAAALQLVLEEAASEADGAFVVELRWQGDRDDQRGLASRSTRSLAASPRPPRTSANGGGTATSSSSRS